MHDAFDRAVGVVADRIGGFCGVLPIELGRIGNELTRDRIVRSAGSMSSPRSGVSETA